ncbi:unnamed protein product [Diamesa hyperborea]
MQKVIPDSCCQFEITFELIKDHPTPTDLKKNISKELVDVFLNTCTPIEKVLFGRDKPLKGPDKLWIDPKDRCGDEKVKFTPLKTDCLQALTHQGILEIGKQFEERIEERNSKRIAKAVKEAEKFADFEANLKLKYHVDYITKKLNEEWQNKFDAVVKQHEYDKSFIMESYEDSREIMKQLMRKTIEDKEDPAELIENAINDTKEQMKNQCNEAINNELALQTANFNEAMQTTLKNLEINDKNKLDKMQNECLKAMDVQCNLFNCKQVTEVMHVMAMEKQSFKIKLSDIQKKHDAEKKEIQEQLAKQRTENKSLNRLWNEFLIDIQQLQIEKFTDYEKKLYKEIKYLENQLAEITEADININSKESQESQLLIIQENVNNLSSSTDLDWIAGNVSNCQQKAVNKANIDVNWIKSANDVELNYEKNFSNYIFEMPNLELRETSEQIANTATVIIDAVRNKKDEKTLEKLVINEIGGVLLKMSKLSGYFDQGQNTELLVAPKTGSLAIRDSLGALNKRVSILTEPVEQNQLVVAVDSFMILSESSHPCNSFRRSNSYLENKSKEKNPTNYKKMSEKEWRNIDALVESKHQRDSVVQFDKGNTVRVNQTTPLREHSPTIPRRRTSSILKRSSAQLEAKKTLQD